MPLLFVLCSCTGDQFLSYASGSLEEIKISLSDQQELDKVFPLYSLYVFKNINKGEVYEPVWNIENQKPSRSVRKNSKNYIYGVVPINFKETIPDKKLMVGEIYSYVFKGYNGSSSYGCFTILQNHKVKNINIDEC